MAHEFRLPDIGEGLTEAEIVRWLVPEGEHVEADQPVVEVETDKAVVEIPSPFAGIVLRHGGAEGETIAVGSVLVVIGDESDLEIGSAPAPTEPAIREEVPRETLPLVPEQPPIASAAPIVGSLSEDAETLSARDEGAVATAADNVKALPIVRKLARDLGVDLTSVQPSGPDGRVTREDVLAAASPSESDAEPEEAAAPPPPAPAEAPSEALTNEAPTSPVADERRPMTRLRRTIAANMSKSWAEIPHVTTFDDVDATRLIEIRSALGARHDTKIPMEALVIKAVVPALQAFPEFNATIDGDDLVIHGSHHIGIAVDTPDGLLVAVIRDAGARGVLDVGAEIRRLGDGAKTRSLGPDELTGQTFTVSNIGAVGGGHGTPIVPYGTTAILSVGRAKEKVIVTDGELAIAPLLPLSLSYDHRVVDGAQGRRFMALVIENLEEPALFLAG
ncbi:MAG: 2-oxo acid dehydrogenase subunit E2 [Actinomycetota bacterium]|nr:2-oxo acid dehydrogenase subunit E2 [Actinomycetota bacterium]